MSTLRCFHRKLPARRGVNSSTSISGDTCGRRLRRQLTHDNGLLAGPPAGQREGGRRTTSRHPSETVIIGDTPLDVAVAVAGGAHCLSVGTGGDVDTLLESGADEAVPDLDRMCCDGCS